MKLVTHIAVPIIFYLVIVFVRFFFQNLYHDLVINSCILICNQYVCNVVKNKVNSKQEACAKCFSVHMIKFEILQTI